MARLVHEVWLDGDGLPGCCLAGPAGDGFRQLEGQGERLVHTFVAGSHFEAMTIYHEYLGREPYTTDQPRDIEPYPDEWRDEQVAAGVWRNE